MSVAVKMQFEQKRKTKVRISKTEQETFVKQRKTTEEHIQDKST
jgi:hypothetical protein